MNKWNNLKKCTFIDEIYIDDENGKPIVIVDTKERNVTYKDEEAKTDDNIQKMITDIFNNLRVYNVILIYNRIILMPKAKKKPFD